MRPIRNSAKAVIIRDGMLLAIEARDDEGPWYLLPGGGQEPGETLAEALVRECQEEIDTTVTRGPLLFIREYIGRNHEFASTDSDAHQIDFMFEGSVNDGYVPTMGPRPDDEQLGVRWLPVADLMSYRLYPLSLRAKLMNMESAVNPVYLGDVN